MQLDDVLAISDDAVAREVGGETVIMHLASGTYFGLNPVGGRVWSLLEDSARPIADICAVIAEEFEVPPSVVEGDVLSLAADLAANDLVTCRSA